MPNNWNISFITEEDFYQHVKATVKTYRSGMVSYNLERLNSNTLDPVKLTIDKSIYNLSWHQVIDNEINEATTVLGTFISEFFSSSKVVKCLGRDGMSYTKTMME